ncbi:MAG: FAD:protein FMN transferase [Candidatus Riflemargulisbacteria bacterium]
MKKFILSFSFIVLLGGLFIINSANSTKSYQESRFLLYTTTEIQVLSNNRQKAEKAINAAFSRIEQIEKEMNLFDPNSELGKINATAYEQDVALSPDMFYILTAAINGSKKSHGAFDITVRPLSKLYGFGSTKKQLPTDKEIQNSLSLVGYQHIKINADKKTIRFLRKGVALDLGGIAKGYAVDEAIKVLIQHEIKNALVNAGGSSIYALGTNQGHPWLIAIRDPKNPYKTTDRVIKLHNQGLSTSGDYEQFFLAGKKKIAHIFDPKTGQPANLETKTHSVTVIANTATEAEVLTKACYILGAEKIKEIIKDKKVYFY